MADLINNSEGKLLRVLSLLAPVIYGIILIRPVYALSLFGHINKDSKWHGITTILVATATMQLIVMSYERKVTLYLMTLYKRRMLKYSDFK